MFVESRCVISKSIILVSMGLHGGISLVSFYLLSLKQPEFFEGTHATCLLLSLTHPTTSYLRVIFVEMARELVHQCQKQLPKSSSHAYLEKCLHSSYSTGIE